MTAALNPVIPDAPQGSFIHPVLRNLCAFPDGTLMTYDPRIKNPEWYVMRGVVNTHGRRQSQVQRKVRPHYQLVYECVSQSLPNYSSIDGNGMTIDHLDGNKDNNAFENLRLVSLRENVRSAHCKSGMPYGVRLRENGNFRVVLRVLGKMTHLGTFKTLEAALARRDQHLEGAK